VHPPVSEDSTEPSGTLADCLIIVPAYNEARSLPKVLFDLRRALPDASLVVIDDGSTDGTADAVPASVTLLRLPFNLGIGAAMQTGYRYAEEMGYRIAVQVDGDGQHPADEVGRLIEGLDGGRVDLVIGSRFLGEATYRQTAARGIGAVLLRTMIRGLSGTTVTDCTSGFRAVNRPVIEAFARWYPDDYPEPEVVATLLRLGRTVVEVPARMNQRTEGRSSITLAGGLLYVLKVSVALFLDRFRNPWAGLFPGSPATRPAAAKGVSGGRTDEGVVGEVRL
jgi:glycosyltransferase involved in cell wall biosynthesis